MERWGAEGKHRGSEEKKKNQTLFDWNEGLKSFL